MEREAFRIKNYFELISQDLQFGSKHSVIIINTKISGDRLVLIWQVFSNRFILVWDL